MSFRSDQLKEWETARHAEVHIDLVAHWKRSIGGLLLGTLLWQLATIFALGPWAKFSICFLAGVYLTSTIIIWLRIWGAYIERRLTEIEARIVNTHPFYYQSGDIESFERNPLFDRLAQIEDRLSRDY
jgi:hypothetical protein